MLKCSVTCLVRGLLGSACPCCKMSARGVKRLDALLEVWLLIERSEASLKERSDPERPTSDKCFRIDASSLRSGSSCARETGTSELSRPVVPREVQTEPRGLSMFLSGTPREV